MGALELLLLASLPLVLLIGLLDPAPGSSEDGGSAAPENAPPEPDAAFHGDAVTDSRGANLLALLDAAERPFPPDAPVTDGAASAPDALAEAPAVDMPDASADGPADDADAGPRPSTDPDSGPAKDPGGGTPGLAKAGPVPLTQPAGPAPDAPQTDTDTAPDAGLPPPATGATANGPAASESPSVVPATGQAEADRASPLPAPEFGRFAAGDPILGTAGSDTIEAPDTSSAIFANGLDARAGAGNLILGGSGDDTLLGGAGPDTLRGGAGNNLLHASYSPELELAQGSDLFAWRDNGLPDILEGGAGDDRLILARGDIATGGGGANVFEIWHDPASAQPVALIADFNPAADRLDVVVRIDEAAHPDCGAWAWDRAVQAAAFETARIDVATDHDTGRTEVLVDGEVVARLLGAPPLDPATLRVFAFWDIRT